MLALALTLLATAEQAPATAWQHTLIRHETVEAIEAGTGEGVHFELGIPLALRLRSIEYYGGRGGCGTCSPAPTRDLRSAWYESATIAFQRGFEELDLSWNVAHPAGTTFEVHLRVGRVADDSWSPWLLCGMNSQSLARSRWPGRAADEDITPREFPGGRVEGARFLSASLWDRAQYRVVARLDPELLARDLDVRRIVLCASRRIDASEAEPLAPVSDAARRSLVVPLRATRGAQLEALREQTLIAATSMLVTLRRSDGLTSSHRAPTSPADAVQRAYEQGVPGYVARFATWLEVEAQIAAGQPLAIEVREPDEETWRWLVLRGFDDENNALVIDPLADKLETGLTREHLTRSWLAKGGTALIFLPREPVAGERGR